MFSQTFLNTSFKKLFLPVLFISHFSPPHLFSPANFCHSLLINHIHSLSAFTPNFSLIYFYHPPLPLCPSLPTIPYSLILHLSPFHFHHWPLCYSLWPSSALQDFLGFLVNAFDLFWDAPVSLMFLLLYCSHLQSKYNRASFTPSAWMCVCVCVCVCVCI